MSADLRWRLRRIDQGFDATGSVRAWAVLRFTIAPLVFIHLRPFVDLMRHDTWYRDRFHESWVSWYPEVGKGTYFWLLRLCLVAAVLASLGIATRVTTIYTAAFVAWNLFLTTTNYHHNRAFLALVLVGVATVPSGRVLSVDAWLARRRGRPLVDDAPLWPLWLLRFEIACVYGGSGLSKLLDADWRGGTVTWDRVLKSRPQLFRSPLPTWFIDLISKRGFHTGFAKVVILTELFIALGLWWKATPAGRRLDGRVVPRVHRDRRPRAGLQLRRHRRPRDLGGAPHARAGGGGAAGAVGADRAGLRLAGPVAGRTGPAGHAAHAGRSRRAHLPRPDRRSGGCSPACR